MVELGTEARSQGRRGHTEREEHCRREGVADDPLSNGPSEQQHATEEEVCWSRGRSIADTTSCATPAHQVNRGRCICKKKSTKSTRQSGSVEWCSEQRSRWPNRLTWELGCQRSSSAIPGQRFRGQGRSARILRHAFQAHMLRCGLSRLARPWPCDSRCQTQKTCWAVGLIR